MSSPRDPTFSCPAGAAAGSITDVPGVEVGHFTDARRPTGCSVVLVRDGACAGVDVRGAAPGTRETDLLDPGNLVDRVNAVLLAGGSAFGLDAASGVVRWLDERAMGYGVGPARVPIVPAAVLFDLWLDDDGVRPDAAAGYAACGAASAEAPVEGSVGAGAGAMVGKLFGAHRAMKGGIGTASVRVGGITVGALIAVNAVGDVVDPGTGRPLAGARSDDGLHMIGASRCILDGELPARLQAGMSTTLGVVATDARLDKAQCQRLAKIAHDGLARTIDPVHTAFDGDTIFALSTGRSGRPADPVVLGIMAAAATARAVVRAIVTATGVRTRGGLHVPACRDIDSFRVRPTD